MNLYSHPENPKCTQAYMLVARGDRQRAIAILEGIGYTDALCQVEMIEGFIRFQAERTNHAHRKDTRRHSDVGN